VRVAKIHNRIASPLRSALTDDGVLHLLPEDNSPIPGIASETVMSQLVSEGVLLEPPNLTSPGAYKQQIHIQSEYLSDERINRKLLRLVAQRTGSGETVTTNNNNNNSALQGEVSRVSAPSKSLTALEFMQENSRQQRKRGDRDLSDPDSGPGSRDMSPTNRSIILRGSLKKFPTPGTNPAFSLPVLSPQLTGLAVNSSPQQTPTVGSKTTGVATLLPGTLNAVIEETVIIQRPKSEPVISDIAKISPVTSSEFSVASSIMYGMQAHTQSSLATTLNHAPNESVIDG
jgi:hypothetical protein